MVKNKKPVNIKYHGSVNGFGHTGTTKYRENKDV